MSIEQRSHELIKRLETKYNHKVMRKHPPVADNLFYTIEEVDDPNGTIMYRRHRHITVH